MSKVQNVKLSPVNEELFINEYLYTDRNSARVIAMSEDGNTAQLVRVHKVSHIKPDFHPGGFCGHTANNEEMYSKGNYHLEDEGEPFILTKRIIEGEELWGENYNPYEIYKMGWPTEEDALSYLEEIRGEIESDRKEIVVMQTRCGWGICYYPLTSTGKRYNRWSKFWSGKIVNHCDWYYDWNF